MARRMATDGRETSRSEARLSIGFLLTRHPAGRISPIMPQVIELLRGKGARVEAIYLTEGVVDLGRPAWTHDLYVLKSGTDLALSFAGALHSTGAVILNSYPVSAACRDKIVLSAILRRAGVPVPDTYAAADPATFSDLLAAGPIVVKPYRGSQGRDVRLVRSADELSALTPADGALIAQRYCQPRGRDRKLYCIGERVFGVKRIWPASTYRDKLGEPFVVGAELREIAMRCGAAFGIGLFGLDVVETDDGPYVVDFSSFPGFKGVPDAARLLADYIWEEGRRAVAVRRDATPSRSTVAIG